MELSYSNDNLYWLFNKNLSYDSLLDYYFVPGEKMYKDILENTDISKDKLIVTGSPKIDLLFGAQKRSFLQRRAFLDKYKIPNYKKNIFIFTTFFGSTEDYIKTDIAFKGSEDRAGEIYRNIELTKRRYLKIIPRICKDFNYCNIVLKPHPLEDFEDYIKIKSNNFFLITNEILNNTLDSIDLAMHWNSTVATECWISGKKTNFPKWVDNVRYSKPEPRDEKKLCMVYSDSRVVIGVHGSNMLLPSAHAGMVVDLMPRSRISNIAEDILYKEETDPRFVSFKYRFLPIGVKFSDLINNIHSMVNDYERSLKYFGLKLKK